MSSLIASGIIGFLLQEALQWLDLRRKLTHEEIWEIIASKSYLIVLFSMASFTGLAIYLVIGEDISHYSNKEMIIIGIAFPGFVRKSISASPFVTHEPQLGGNIRGYFS